MTAYRLMADDLSHSFIHALYEDPLGIQPRFQVLELAGLLQTTLDLGELLGLFLRGLQAHVEFDGIRYRHPDQGIELTKGLASGHSLAYTLNIKGQPLGEVSFYRTYTPFGRDEVQTLEGLLAALLYPLRNTLQYRSALLSASLDPLTQVGNRAAMDRVLQREVELARRQTSPLSVILLDIDHFKQINDTHGHRAGDCCLQAVAKCVQDSIRGSDLLFRCGGEEFLVLLSQTQRDGALQLAERVRRQVQDLVLPANGQGHLSISLGVTALQPEDVVSSLYERADQALYRAKQGGRNRVETL